jgi:L-threonylcarbamoyladenylate synthase
METLLLETILESPALRSRIGKMIRAGKIFVYPTDTVYGLGCDATNQEAVEQVRAIKKSGQPFSVIAPSKEWIRQRLIVRFPEYLDRLPGPYTLIFRMRQRVVPDAVSTHTLGVRIPDHPLVALLQETGLPFLTTSCNIHGALPAVSVRAIARGLLGKADIVIDGGLLTTPPSTVIDLTGARPKVLRK